LDRTYLGIKATPRQYTRYDRNPRVSFVIDGNGNVADVRLLESSGSTELDHRVVGWLGNLRYSPQSGCGSWKVETSVNIEF
jgi:TonB family protein